MTARSVGCSARTAHHRVDQPVEALHRHEAADRHDQGLGVLGAARGEARVDPRRRHRHLAGREARAVRRSRSWTTPTASRSRSRGTAAGRCAARARCRGRPGAARAPSATSRRGRGARRRRGAAGSTAARRRACRSRSRRRRRPCRSGPTGRRRPCAGTPRSGRRAADAVAVAADLPGRAVDPRGPQPHVDAGGGPARQHLVGVQFGAAGLGVVEVAPGHHVDPAHLGGGHHGGERLGADLVVAQGVERLQPAHRIDGSRREHVSSDPPRTDALRHGPPPSVRPPSERSTLVGVPAGRPAHAWAGHRGSESGRVAPPARRSGPLFGPC